MKPSTAKKKAQTEACQVFQIVMVSGMLWRYQYGKNIQCSEEKIHKYVVGSAYYRSSKANITKKRLKFRTEKELGREEVL